MIKKTNLYKELIMAKEIHTKENLVLLFKQLQSKIGSLPTKRQWTEDAKTPSDMPVRQNFGGWNKFLIYMGIEPRKPQINLLARKNSAKAHKGRKSFNYKGGRTKEKGYISIYKPKHPNSNKNGYIREHRFIMSNKIGRPLLGIEDVHHINGIRDDNRIENLELISRAEHTRKHHLGIKKTLIKAQCIFPDCSCMTASGYKLCNKHFKLQWQRKKAGIICNYTEFPTNTRKHSELTKELLSRIACSQPRKKGRFAGNIHEEVVENELQRVNDLVI